MAVGDERFERPTGTVDGANRDFTTASAYQAGSLRVWQNGLLKRQPDDDGWDETGGTTFRTREAYRIGDTIHVRYLEA